MNILKDSPTDQKILDELFETYLNPTFVDPLKNLGFKLESYGHQEFKPEGDFELEGGTHTLIFTKTGALHQSDVAFMREICTQDDDSQPNATYRYYMGTLFLFIPYFA